MWHVEYMEIRETDKNAVEKPEEKRQRQKLDIWQTSINVRLWSLRRGIDSCVSGYSEVVCICEDRSGHSAHMIVVGK